MANGKRNHDREEINEQRAHCLRDVVEVPSREFSELLQTGERLSLDEARWLGQAGLAL